ncbi:hypothetical protein [Celeribacter baekdonensis]|uniref:hypothetical protein n=2 Tax=Roseobacteraceae TaxID=2854170 RepID=UPI0026EB6EB2|nr:hypothetical protein [Celeribacter baekdonensis]|tara:strand:+ start:3252 stop:4157 length:906 start_codon:yes stop_codon:yes gene_type:complete
MTCSKPSHPKQIALVSLCFGLGFGASCAGTANADSWLLGEGWVMLGATDGLDHSSKDEALTFGGNGTWSTHGDGLGLSFGAFGNLGRLHETYAAVTWQTVQGDRFSVGNPRPAYDLFARPALTDVFLSAALERSEVGLSRATDGTITEPKYLPLGASYTRNGAAMSLHYVENYDTYILGVSGRMDLSDMSVDAALELVDGDTTKANAKLQLNRDLGPGAASASLFYSGANAAGTELELAYRHPVGGRVTLSEIVSVPLSEPDQALVALGAQVGLGGAWSLNAAASYADTQSAFMAGLRLEF